MKPNKQKTDWDFNGDFEDIQLGVTKSEDIKNRKFITSWLNIKRLELLTRFDTQKKQFIKTQREEIIKEIEGIVEQRRFAISPVDEILKEIRERLKQITNLKEK